MLSTAQKLRTGAGEGDAVSDDDASGEAEMEAVKELSRDDEGDGENTEVGLIELEGAMLELAVPLRLRDALVEAERLGDLV